MLYKMYQLISMLYIHTITEHFIEYTQHNNTYPFSEDRCNIILLINIQYIHFILSLM